MEAKDTVMTSEQALNTVDALSEDNLFEYWIGDKPLWKIIAEAQAEISFKAGYEQREKDPLDKEDRCDLCYEQGMRKVVEWMKEPCPHAPRNFPSDKRMCVNCLEAKLEEWGIETKKEAREPISRHLP